MTRKVKYSRNRGIWPIFLVCPRFIQLRINATSQLKTSIETTLEIFHTNSEHLTDLAKLINGLFLKPDSWPTSQIYYYYGVIPKIDLETHNLPHLSHTQLQRIHQHISNDFHSTAIKLARRIWGIIRQTFSPFQSSSKTPTVLTLPSHLSHITTSSTRLSIKHNM
jgi:vacuolar-type H+-ATPase subunit F/Vma7